MQVSSPSDLTRYRDRQESSELSELPEDLDLFHENDNRAWKDQTLELGDNIDDSLVLAGLPEILGHHQNGKSGVKRKAKSRSYKARYRKRRKTTLMAIRRAERSYSSDDAESEASEVSDGGRFTQDPFWRVIVGDEGSLDRAVGFITAAPGESMNKTADIGRSMTYKLQCDVHRSKS
jgi:hypothetical protein